MNSCRTTVKMYDFEYQWTITNFNLHTECASKRIGKSTIKSSSFMAGENNTTWHLELEFYGIEDVNKDYIGIFTYCESCKENNEIWASWKLFLLNNETEKIPVMETSLCGFDMSSFSKGWSRFYEKNKLLEQSDIYLPKNNLTLIIQLQIMGNVFTTPEEVDIPKLINNNLSADFSKLLINKNFTDVTFVLDNEEIGAHKNIMAVRSPVFAAMFEHQMQERNENVVEIIDIERNIFEKMLQFIYTNQVDNLEDVAMELFPVADKYELEDLKEMCERIIGKNITIESAAEVFILADRHNAKRLLETTRDYMQHHIVDIMATGGYQTMENQHPKLTAKLLRSMMLKSPIVSDQKTDMNGTSTKLDTTLS